MKNTKALVGITALVAGVSIGIVALVAIFSPDQLHVAAWIVAPLCFMGGALGFWITRSAER